MKQEMMAGVMILLTVLVIFFLVYFWTRHCSQFVLWAYENVPLECKRLLIVR